jgi:cytochrome c553
MLGHVRSGFVAAIAALVALPILAQDRGGRADGDALALLRANDIEAGRRVVVGGAANGGPGNACLACHGPSGTGDPSGAFPRLAGLAAWYQYKQLKDYASGARPNPIMAPIARSLSDKEMQDVSAFYASRTDAPFFPAPEADPRLLQMGAALSAVGSAESGVQACVNCHGPAGAGVPPSFPRLAGQYASYQAFQFRLWKEGVRQNDPLGVMREIASRLTDEQIRAVSVYFENVRPPDATAGGTPGASSGGSR